MVPLSTQTFWTAWQNVPPRINPVAFEIGGLPVYWYALFFIAGSLLVYFFAAKAFQEQKIFTKEQYTDFAFGTFVASIVGGKLGYLLFYWWPFVQSSTHDLIPRNSESLFGFPGMSFVGGAVTVALYIFYFARKYKKDFFILTDILVVFIPIGIFFGRLGNFFHNELWGRITTLEWGMYFPGAITLRHPSTLYGALLEGFILFVFLFIIKKRVSYLHEGAMTAYFCMGYGVLRFISECFREPDSQIGYLVALTINQFFAIIIFIIGVIIYTVKKRKNTVY